MTFLLFPYFSFKTQSYKSFVFHLRRVPTFSLLIFLSRALYIFRLFLSLSRLRLSQFDPCLPFTCTRTSTRIPSVLFSLPYALILYPFLPLSRSHRHRHTSLDFYDQFAASEASHSHSLENFPSSRHLDLFHIRFNRLRIEQR